MNMSDQDTRPENMKLASIRNIARTMRKMHIANGDVILVKMGTNFAKKEHIEDFVKAGGKMGLDKVVIMVVDELDDIRKLDEKEMNKYGWYKMDSLVNRVIKDKPA